MPIIARAHDIADCERLVRAGATAAVPETYSRLAEITPTEPQSSQSGSA